MMLIVEYIPFRNFWHYSAVNCGPLSLIKVDEIPYLVKLPSAHELLHAVVVRRTDRFPLPTDVVNRQKVVFGAPIQQLTTPRF